MTDLLAIAEAPAAHIVPRHPAVVIGDGYVVSQMGRTTGSVQAIRLAPERLDETREVVRALAREREWDSFSWWVSELTLPADLGERLGLEREETVTALALVHPPAAGGDVEVRPVTTLEEFTTAQRIDVLSHGGTPDGDEAAHAAAWERLRDTFLLWLAYVDGRPVGMGRAGRSQGALMLIGGATLPEARGRGVYRALVAARWEEAIRRGTPALVVAANDQSAPILRKLGFEELGTIRLFADGP